MSSESEPNDIAMRVGGIVVDPGSQVPVVVLRGIDEPRLYLPIFIGGLEATSIATVLAEVALPRPMTHDLMVQLLETLAARLERVTITRLSGGTFFAELTVTDDDGGVHAVDARPSDGIALALRVSAPIFVAREVVLEAGAMAEEGVETDDVGGAAPEAEADEEADEAPADETVPLTPGARAEEQAPTVLSGRKVRLEDLDPEDFGKYKM